MMTPKTIDIATTATDCLKVDCLSGQEIFLNSAFSPSKNLGFAVFSAESPIITSFLHNCSMTQIELPLCLCYCTNKLTLCLRLRSDRLLGLLVHGMGPAESAVLLGLHTVGMCLLILCGIVVTLFAFCTC